METISINDIASNVFDIFGKVADGKTVLVKWRDKMIKMEVVTDNPDETISDELKARVAEARKSYAAGNYVACQSHEEIEKLFASL